MHAAESESDAGLDGAEMVRDARGRFRRGHPGGPGRPPKTTELRFLRVIGDAVSESDLQEIAKAAVRFAKDGDADARSWISRHLLPNPDRATLSDARRAEARTSTLGYSNNAMRVALESVTPGTAAPGEHEDLAELLTERGLID